MGYESAAHLISGGIAGTVATILTSPLEVLKTRLQSSVYKTPYDNVSVFKQISHVSQNYTQLMGPVNKGSQTVLPKHTFETEGVRGLFKGLVPNLIGVAPARAIYFCSYSNAKKFFNTKFKPDSSVVFIISAASASFVTSTLTNPIWFIKTRLQLDQSKFSEVKLTVGECIRQTYKSYGIRGFYKGVTASYYGISETAINFLIYENIKKHLLKETDTGNSTSSATYRFFQLMASAGIAKTFAASFAYPHEVARTRLREGKLKYRSFWQTIFIIAREEGANGIYRGLLTHLLRQIPNTAITLATYETLVYLFKKHSITKSSSSFPVLDKKTIISTSTKTKSIEATESNVHSLVPQTGNVSSHSSAVLSQHHARITPLPPTPTQEYTNVEEGTSLIPFTEI